MGKNTTFAAPARRRPGVLVVAPWRVNSQGGVNGVINHLIDEMTRAGAYRPVLLEIAWQHPRPVWRTDHPCATASMRLRGTSTGRTGPRRVIAPLALLFTLPAVLVRLSKLVRDNDIQFINIHYPGVQAVAFILLKRFRLFGGPLLVSVHNSDVRAGLELTGLARWAWRWVLHDADAIVAVSRQLSVQLTDRWPRLSSRIHVAYNGVDPGAFARVHAKGFELPNRVKTLLCVASFDLRKGVDVLLHAFAKVVASHANIRLLIVGESGADDDTLFSISKQLNLDGLVDWRSGLSYAEIAETLAQADLFVLPSRNEGFPLALLEAGATGLPVVATRVGGVPELIQHRKTGLLVPPDDVGSLAETLSYALDNPEIAARMGDELRQLVVAQFSWRAMYERYSAILETGKGHP